MVYRQVTTLCLLLGLLSCVVADRFSVHKDHLKEELNHMMPEEDFNMENEEEMEFHYFKVHDHDNDNRLDGLELGAAMTHYHDSNNSEGTGDDTHKQVDVSDAELESLINQILKEDDLNDDGYVDYYEFLSAQRRMKSNTESQ